MSKDSEGQQARRQRLPPLRWSHLAWARPEHGAPGTRRPVRAEGESPTRLGVGEWGDFAAGGRNGQRISEVWR